MSCFIGIGSNLGRREYYINSALKKIKLLSKSRLKKVSSIIETHPEGNLAQPEYLNAVAEIETELFPYQLLGELQNIELSLGRTRPFKNAARTIDLDILLYADACMNEECLCIPHPRILERKFVLECLKEIAPGEVKNLLKKAKKIKAKPKSR